MTATITALSLAPVKGMRIQRADALELGPTGARDDRRFCVVDPDGALLLTTRTPRLLPQGPNQRWSLDFASDTLTDGRRWFPIPRCQARVSHASWMPSSPAVAVRCYASVTTARS